MKNKTILTITAFVLVMAFLLSNINFSQAQTNQCVGQNYANCPIGLLECYNGKIRTCNGEGGGGTSIQTFWCGSNFPCEEESSEFTALEGGDITPNKVFNEYIGTASSLQANVNLGENAFYLELFKKNENGLYVNFPSSEQNPDITEPLLISFSLPIGEHDMRVKIRYEHQYQGQSRETERITNFKVIVNQGLRPSDDEGGAGRTDSSEDDDTTPEDDGGTGGGGGAGCESPGESDEPEDEASQQNPNTWRKQTSINLGIPSIAESLSAEYSPSFIELSGLCSSPPELSEQQISSFIQLQGLQINPSETEIISN